MFRKVEMWVISVSLLVMGAACTPSVNMPPVHEPLDSEEWKKCASKLAEQEATTMIADLTLDSKTMVCQGVVLAVSGEVEKALEMLSESALRDKEDHRPHYLAGRILAENARYEEALTEFERASKRFPTIEIPAERIGRKLEKENKLDEARIFLGKALERNLCSYGCKGVLARLHHKSGDDDKARNVYKQMTKDDPTEPAGFVGLAGIANRAGEYREEARFLEKAMRAKKFSELSGSQKADIHYSIAFANYNSEEYAAAAQSIKEANALVNDRADWHVLAGWIDMKRNRPETALSSFKRATDFDSNLAAAHAGEGDARMALNEAERARFAYEKAKELDATNSVYILKLAWAAAVLKDFDSARGLVDEAARLDKEHLPPELLKKVTDLLPAE